MARYSLYPSLFDFSVSCLLISSKGIGEKNLTFSCVSGSVESEIFRVFSISWRGISGKMAGKGGKGLLAAKTMAAGKDKDKKKPVSRSSRAGLQVLSLSLSWILDFFGFLEFSFSVNLIFCDYLWKGREQLLLTGNSGF